MRVRWLWMIVSVGWVAVLGACSGSGSAMPVGSVPTIAQLPTITPPPPTLTPQPVSATPPTIYTATPRPPEVSEEAIAPAPTNEATVTPSMTITDTPTSPPTATATVTATPPGVTGLDALADLARRTTITPYRYTGTPPTSAAPRSRTHIQPLIPLLPPSNILASGAAQNAIPTLSAPPDCATAGDVFGTVEATYPDTRLRLGCPVGGVVTVSAAYQVFSGGFMVWIADPNGGAGTIYAAADTFAYSAHPDTWIAGVDPERGNESPPAGLVEPIRGFGKVWRENTAVRDALGWALAVEAGMQVSIQRYERGAMMTHPQRGEVILWGSDGTWLGLPTG